MTMAVPRLSMATAITAADDKKQQRSAVLGVQAMASDDPWSAIFGDSDDGGGNGVDGEGRG